MSAAKAALAAELELFDSKKSAWLKQHRNQYVVIRGKKPLGFFVTFAIAYYAGAEAFGSGSEFLVKKIVEQEPVYVVY